MTDECPATERSPDIGRLAAARVWLHATTRSPDLLESIMARRVLAALDQDAALGADAHRWLAKRRDRIHREWSQAVLDAIEERTIG